MNAQRRATTNTLSAAHAAARHARAHEHEVAGAMRWTQLFAPTLRENPGGADSTSHRLLLRARKLRVDTTVVEADIDYPTDADLLEQAVRKLGGLVRRVKARGAASRTRFRDRGRAAARASGWPGSRAQRGITASVTSSGMPRRTS